MLKDITQKRLNEILENHKIWLSKYENDANFLKRNAPFPYAHGTENEDMDKHRADLSNYYLMEMDFEGVDLRGANLRGSNLHMANLKNANLKGANLSMANLHNVNLEDANLSDSNLLYANLSYGILYNTNFNNACMQYANLYHAKLVCADLSDADLMCANLKNANLSGSNLLGAYLNDADCRYANMTKANIENTVLCHALLTGASLDAKIVQISPLESNDDAILYSIDDNIVQYYSRNTDLINYRYETLESFKKYAQKESKKECLKVIPYLESLKNNFKK